MLDLIRKEILKHYSHHIASSFSCVEILKVLYDHILTENDFFILSKGHAAPALYTILMLKGIIDEKDLSEYGLHCDYRAPGIPFTTGSLGCGIGLGVGVALSKKLKGENGKIYILCGDGEMSEGSAKESASWLKYQSIRDRVFILVDWNKLSATDKEISDIDYHHLVPYGNDEKALSKYMRDCLRPGVTLIATVKSKGIPQWEGKPLAHSWKMTDKLREELLE